MNNPNYSRNFLLILAEIGHRLNQLPMVQEYWKLTFEQFTAMWIP